MAELREALGFYEGYYAVGEDMGSWCLMAKRGTPDADRRLR